MKEFGSHRCSRTPKESPKTTKLQMLGLNEPVQFITCLYQEELLISIELNRKALNWQISKL